MIKPGFRFVELETSRLLLRKYNLDDSTDAFEIYNNMDVMKYSGMNIHSSVMDTKRFIDDALSTMEKEKNIFWAIVLKSLNKVIGDISLSNIDYQHSFASLGLFLSMQYWKKGIMLEASKKMLIFTFEEIGLNRIEAQIFIDNLPSIKIVEKLKFSREAEIRENFLIEGRYRNSYLFSLLRSDYEINKPFYSFG